MNNRKENLKLLLIKHILYFQVSEAPADELNAIAFESGWIRLLSEAGESRILTVSS